MKAEATKADEFSAFLDRLGRLPTGFSRGNYGGTPYGVTIDRSTGWTKLFARELGGREIISFNLYRTPAGEIHLRPCEMSSARAIDFVRGFAADTEHAALATGGS